MTLDRGVGTSEARLQGGDLGRIFLAQRFNGGVAIFASCQRNARLEFGLSLVRLLKWPSSSAQRKTCRR